MYQVGDMYYLVDDIVVKCEVVQTVVIANQCISCTLKSVDHDVMWEQVTLPRSQFNNIFDTYEEAIEAWNRRAT